MKKISKTSWTTEQLSELINADNHKVVYDGYHYRWHKKILGKWSIQSLQLYDTYDKASHHLHYWLAKWREELNSRIDTENKILLKKTKDNRRKIARIVRRHNLDVTEKALEIHKLNDKLTHQDIANELGVSKKTIQRAFKR